MNFSHHYLSRRSNVIGRHGMVATSQPLAAQAGLEILRAGGNALDAAIATAATLCVVEPTSTGIGGDAFALIWIEADQTLYGLNASGPAPADLSADDIRHQGHTIFPQLGGNAVTVPGSLRGWEKALARFGTMPLNQLLDQAIHYAAHGFPVSEKIAAAWARSKEKMSRQTASRETWYPDGRAPRPAEPFANPDFARTLQAIAAEGVGVFYQGPIADAIVGAVQADGGRLTADDLAAYEAEWIDPISIDYRDGYRFYEIPPNGQGLTALLALNIVKGFDLQASGHGTTAYNHILMEAIKMAFADAEAYIADPKKSDIPLAGLLSDRYTAERQRRLDLNRALPPAAGNPQLHGDTVYLTTADEEGNMVSWIQSLYMGFGSGLTAPGTGIQLQNRGANFSLEKGHPNEAAGGKRPYHTIIPGFITHHGRAWSSFGVMGGFMQPQGHLQVGSALVDFGMSPQAALDAPRFNWQSGLTFALEPAFGPDMTRTLQALGHEILPAAEAARLSFGGGQVIVRDPENGSLIGGSEPRNDGCAVAF